MADFRSLTGVTKLLIGARQRVSEMSCELNVFAFKRTFGLDEETSCTVKSHLWISLRSVFFRLPIYVSLNRVTYKTCA